jgi:hypothetical protein
MITNNFSYIFSYWLFLWSVLYILNIVNFNPLPLLIPAIFINLVELFIMFYYKNSTFHIIIFTILLIVMKLIPYLLIRNNKVKRNDIIFSIFIYGIYIVWLYITGKNIIDLLNEYIIRIKKDKALGPITTFLEKTIKSYS